LKKIEGSNMFKKYIENDESIYYIELDIESLGKNEDELVESVRSIIDNICNDFGLY